LFKNPSIVSFAISYKSGAPIVPRTSSVAPKILLITELSLAVLEIEIISLLIILFIGALIATLPLSKKTCPSPNKPVILLSLIE